MEPVRSHETTVSGTLEGVIAAADWLHDVADEERLPGDLAYALEVCIEELLTNLARHGGLTAGRGEKPPNPPPTARLSLAIAEDSVELVVEDDGNAFDVSAAPAQPVRQPLSEPRSAASAFA